jgi:hypothetical protein
MPSPHQLPSTPPPKKKQYNNNTNKQQNVHRISHRRMAQMRDKEGGARGLAITVSAVVAPAFTRHLLIKLLDHKGRGIGQVRVCFWFPSPKCL